MQLLSQSVNSSCQTIFCCNIHAAKKPHLRRQHSLLVVGESLVPDRHPQDASLIAETGNRSLSHKAISIQNNQKYGMLFKRGLGQSCKTYLTDFHTDELSWRHAHLRGSLVFTAQKKAQANWKAQVDIEVTSLLAKPSTTASQVK